MVQAPVHPLGKAEEFLNEAKVVDVKYSLGGIHLYSCKTYNRIHIRSPFPYVRIASNNHVFGLLFTEDDTWMWIHEHAIDFPSDDPPPKKRRRGSREPRSVEQVKK